MKKSDEPVIGKCELRLDYCEPESHPIPTKDEVSREDKILIYGRFANVPISKVVFSLIVTVEDKEVFQEDKKFIKEGTVQRVQFNQILVPVRIFHGATPGTRYFTITQGKTVDKDGVETECTVKNADISFKLT